MKKLLIFGFIFLFVMPISVFAKDKKVKVYIFEAGGCPFCEQEIEYLKGLSSYNEKFEIVEMELYKDHIDWEQGKDFTLGYDVAMAFQSAGYENASYNSTPFVVISNFYAESMYSNNLEQYIDRAYEEGDKDVVECIKNNQDDCAEIIEERENTLISDENQDNEKDSQSTNSWLTPLLVVVFSIIILATYIIKSEIDKRKILEAINEKNIKEKTKSKKVLEKK